MPDIPLQMWFQHPAFERLYVIREVEGMARAKTSHIAIVGLARNCAARLAQNLGLAVSLGEKFLSWKLHVEANDCEDATASVLKEFCTQYPQASYRYQELNRGQYDAEFQGRRTIAMAEYRTACQEWVRRHAADAEYVMVVDFDLWGGWNERGLLNGIGWLVEMQGAYGMASVSLFQFDFGNGPQWSHYDLWALRGLGQPECYWDTYQGGYGGFGYSWLPPVGSPPAIVASAFGGVALYRTEAYLRGTYDGRDCEHVPFHESIAAATGQHLYVNPSQRTLVHWLPDPCVETPAPSA